MNEKEQGEREEKEKEKDILNVMNFTHCDKWIDFPVQPRVILSTKMASKAARAEFPMVHIALVSFHLRLHI